MFNHVAPYRYLLPNLYLYVADIANPNLFGCGSQTWISLDITCFYEEHCQPSSGSAWPACQKYGNRAPIAGGRRVRHNLHRGCQTVVTTPLRVGCVVWNLCITVSVYQLISVSVYQYVCVSVCQCFSVYVYQCINVLVYTCIR